jgi:hypothetical protein
MLKTAPPSEFPTLKHLVFEFVSDFGFRIYARLGRWYLQDAPVRAGDFPASKWSEYDRLVA